MKKFLLPEGGNFYKANLHCHTTLSDGSLTPEQVKSHYKAKGYSIVAYTDHDILIPHDDLNDEDFLALHGFEMEINEARLTRVELFAVSLAAFYIAALWLFLQGDSLAANPHFPE